MAIDDVNVLISAQTTKVTQAGFGVPLILEEHTAFDERTKSYADITELSADFASTTKVYKMASAVFAQDPALSLIKVGKKLVGDASLTAALDAIVNEDNDWYGLLAITHAKADIQALAAWAETNKKIYGTASEDADIFTSATTDVISSLQSSAYDRTFSLAHHQGGVDEAAASITTASEIATVTVVAHGLRINDPITVSGAADGPLNGNFVVADTPTDDTFTYSAPGAADGADLNNGSIAYFARYLYPEAAWMGKILPDDPGINTWKFKTLAGQNPVPSTVYGTSELGLAEGKNGNIYVTKAGVNITREGIMASGDFIDVRRGVDWLDARLEEGIFTKLVNAKKIPYTNAGLAIIENAIREVLNQALEQTVISPLSDEKDYELVVPPVTDIPTADRQARNFPSITFKARVGNAVHGVTVNGTLEV